MTLNTLYFKYKYQALGRAPKKNPGSTHESDAKKLEDLTKKTFGKDVNDILEKQVEYINKATAEIDGYSTGLNKSVAFQEKFAAGIMKGVKSATLFEEVESQNIKTLKIGTAELLKRRVAYNKMNDSLKFTNDELTEFMKITQTVTPLYGKLLATMATDSSTGVKGFVEAQFKAQNILERNTQLSSDQQAELVAYSAATGTSLANQVLAWEQISAGLGESIDKETAFQLIAEGIAGTGADIRAQFSKMPGNIEMAVLKAKKLGLSLEDLNTTGEGLLDIEQSVGKELEYQQLSGKRLIKDGKSLTNAYREAFLSGDAEKMADTMDDILETQEDVLSGTNYYAKKALAEALGMDVKSLMAVREKKKATEQLNAVAAKGSEGLQKMVKELDNMELTPEQLEKMKQKIKVDFSSDPTGLNEATTALDNLYKQQGAARTPAENIQRRLDSVIQGDALKVIGAKGVETFIQKSKEDAEKIEASFNYAPIQAFIKELQGGLVSVLGQQQIKQNLIQSNVDVLTTISKTIPLLGQTAEKLINAVNSFTGKYATGQSSADASLGQGMVKQEDAVIGINDGIMSVNDGISMQFNPNDKMTIVAGPYGSINDKTADKLTQSGQFGAKMATDQIQTGEPSLPEFQSLPMPLVESVQHIAEMLPQIHGNVNKSKNMINGYSEPTADSGFNEDILQQIYKEEEERGLTDVKQGSALNMKTVEEAIKAARENAIQSYINEFGTGDKLQDLLEASKNSMFRGEATVQQNKDGSYSAFQNLSYKAPEREQLQLQDIVDNTYEDELENLENSDVDYQDEESIGDYETDASDEDYSNYEDTGAEFENISSDVDLSGLIQVMQSGFQSLSSNNNNTSNSSIDTNAIVQAIQEGLKQVTITVKLDPMAVHKEIEFNIG